MKTILTILFATSLCTGLSAFVPEEPVKPKKVASRDCAKHGHMFGPWYKQAQMFYLPEQPAHICTACGAFQNFSGRFMQLVNQQGRAGGLGKLSAAEAEAQVKAEVLTDFKTWERYLAASPQSK